MPELIIADTSCLILLSKLNLLNLLKDIYSEVSITSIIASEYGLVLPDWINVIVLPDQEIIPFTKIVDRGEASAIALAKRYVESLLILDDIKARNLAKQLNLNFTGTIGVLLFAKEQGYIKEIAAVLQQIKQTNFYISPLLEAVILRSAGEHINNT